MIGRLSGRVIDEDGDGTVVLDVAGVGYEVLMPLGSLGRLRAGGDGLVTVHVHTHVREDQISLFGFATASDRVAFRTLLSVSSVGPKIALAVLSALPADELAGVIARKEIARLTGVSGVGKKTAERLLLELRDKLAPGPSATVPLPVAAATRAGPSDPRSLLLGALTRLGYKASEAERAIGELGDRVDGAPLAELVREALRLLA